MAIPTDPERKEALARIVGQRLKACRRAAGISQAQAAFALKHKGITQVSLAEDGQRLPPLVDLYKYAELYTVPLDFLTGRIDDPIAEACEQNQAMMVRSVANSIGALFQKFAAATGEHVSVSLSNLRQDRFDLAEAVKLAEEADLALMRMRELNPEFDDLRGGSRLDSVVRQLAAIGRRMESRTREERQQFDMIDRALEMERIVQPLEQFQLAFQFAPVAPAGKVQDLVAAMTMAAEATVQ